MKRSHDLEFVFEVVLLNPSNLFHTCNKAFAHVAISVDSPLASEGEASPPSFRVGVGGRLGGQEARHISPTIQNKQQLFRAVHPICVSAKLCLRG